MMRGMYFVMLIEVMCDKLLSFGKPRGKIIIKPGLNTIMGTDVGSNSIGKSTFLMIIDFVFGGNDYVEKLTEVQTEVGEHTICFAFQFSDGVHYFSRSSVNYKYVQQCNSSYQPIENGTITLDDFCKYLLEHYGMGLDGLTFRSAVGRSMRIYKRETLDVEFPLQAAKKEKLSDGIKALLKLTNLYSGVAAQSKATELAKEQHSTFKKAQSFAYIPSVKNHAEFKKNAGRIEELNARAEELAEKSSKGVLTLDTMQADKVSELQYQLKQLKRQKRTLNAKLKSIQSDRDLGTRSFTRGYEELQRFFPNADIQRIDAIESFHRKLSGILKTEFTEEIKQLQTSLDLIDTEIKSIETEISDISKLTTLSKAVLEEYASISKELKTLEQANENYNKEKQLAQNVKDYEQNLNAIVIQQIALMQQQINDEMKRINLEIYGKEKTAPILTISNSKTYSFFTPKDGGTGTEYRGLVVFDLAMLSLTCLPVIAHDSVLLKQIEDYAIEKILELYSSSGKQVFIAMDKKTSYSERAQEIMSKTTILQLEPDKGALFGRAWNSGVDDDVSI